MNGRKLAQVERISKLEPVTVVRGRPASNNYVSVATVLGWELIVPKDKFKVGDLCVFVEIDSVIPVKTDCDDMKKRTLVKITKSHGICSQGKALPITVLDNYCEYAEGDDVTEVLGIVKQDCEKYDNMTIQNIPWVVSQDNKFYVTEKLDGTSVTYFHKDSRFGVCSRNYEVFDKRDVYYTMGAATKLEEKLRVLGKNIALQAKIIGHKINFNNYKMKGVDVYFYNVFDIDEQKYYKLRDMQVLLQQLQLNMVPLIHDNFQLPQTSEELIKMADSKSLLNFACLREGVVLRELTNDAAVD